MAGGRSRRVLLTAMLGIAACGLTGISPGLAAGNGNGHHTRVRVVTAGIGSDAAAAFRGQVMSWTPCIDAANDPGLPAAYYKQECSTLTAPMDWDDPGTGRTIKIAVSRLPASRSPAAGALFTNPGGPGGSGINLPLLFLSDGRTALTRSQDIYGIDVRGTGLSSNATCGGPGSSLLDPRNRDPENLDLLMDGAAYTARSCQFAGGDFIRTVNTEQTVQDYELLRTVIGVDKINWIGYSAGTWLGAYYAQAFPAHVGHMVLDSNTDFSAGWQQAFELQPLGFERRFREDFAPWAARWDKYYKLGATPEQVIASYERIRAGMTSLKPIDSAVMLDQTIAGAMYSKYMFPLAALVLDDLDTAVSAAHTGHSRAAARAYSRAASLGRQLRRPGAQLARQPMSSDAGDATFLAVTCNDTPWTRDRANLATTSGLLGAQYPLLGYAVISDPCYFWNRQLTGGVQLTPPTGAGDPPILMVQSEHDPATPIEGARKAAASFQGARMLVVKGEGDHGIYAGGNRCVDTAVEKFVVTGTLPAEGATCNALPMPTPESYGYGTFTRGTTSAGSAAARTTSRGLPVRGTNPLLALRTLDKKISP